PGLRSNSVWRGNSRLPDGVDDGAHRPVRSSSQRGHHQMTTLRFRRISSSLAPHVAVLAILTFAVFPFYWAVVSTLKPTTELYTLTPTFLPNTWTLDNYLWATNQDTFLLTLRNSVIVACSR